MATTDKKNLTPVSKAKNKGRPPLKKGASKETRVTVTGRPRPDDHTIDLEFILPPDVPIHYVDNVSVLHTQTEFTISFLQVQPPLIAEESDWKKVKTVQSKCVARIVLNPLKMQAMLNVLNGNFRRYVQKYAEQEADDGAENPQAGDNA